MKVKNMSFSSRVVKLTEEKTLTLPARDSVDITEEEFQNPEIQRLFAERSIILLPQAQPQAKSQAKSQAQPKGQAAES